jgi:hypothetical protein
VIDSDRLLSDLQARVTQLRDDLRARCETDAAAHAPLLARYEAAKTSGRTAATYNAWREDELDQVAVAWVLATVFVRFLEDNALVETCALAGPDRAGLRRAWDAHELFFRQNPHATEREYLLGIFEDSAKLPGMAALLDRRHNPLWTLAPSGDAAKDLLDFWRRDDPENGHPLHDFSDPDWNTRFLGDLYQDLSAMARKRFALLQTPDFVEQFILDRTLTPAIETFGFRTVRMIDPTCGSGHFLLGGFARLHRLWLEAAPGEVPAKLAQNALDQVFGVDLNPNVVAIARFRLLLAALRVSGTRQLRHAPDFKIHVATGDSLLHGKRFREFEENSGPQRTFDTGEEEFRDALKHHYEVEDRDALQRILGQQYHAVVGNPPYITVKDAALSKLYRDRYPSCGGKYALSVPFMERFFDLAFKWNSAMRPAGFVGQITSNSFMKREFGKKLIEEYIPRWDLTHVIDTSGAYIPGHGTPTVILFGKNQRPVSGSIRTVLGIRGEPNTPEKPSKGVVWQAILRQVDQEESQSEWVSSTDSVWMKFHQHPWSIGGGGAAELKEQIEEVSETTLGKFVDQLRGKPNIGITAFTLEDDAFIQPDLVLQRQRLCPTERRPMVEGDSLRDWEIRENQAAVWPYDSDFCPVEFDSKSALLRFLWVARNCLSRNVMFGQQTKVESGLAWYEFGRLTAHKLRTPLTITFAFVATHNHFVLDRGGKVFNRSAPVIKLKREATEQDHIRLLGVLNSSTACFWMQQVFQNRGGPGGGSSKDEKWHDFYEHDGSKLAKFPIPLSQPFKTSSAIVTASEAMQSLSPAATLARWTGGDLKTQLSQAKTAAETKRRQMIAWQEELDWQVYEAYTLITPEDALSVPEESAVESILREGIALGERAFEIVLARRMAAGEVTTIWFTRHGSTPITEVPGHWPAAYRERVERRIARIESDPNIRLIEQPAYKRRWNTEPWDAQFQKAAKDWLLARLEGYFFEGSRVCALTDGFAPTGFAAAQKPALTSTNALAGIAQTDALFLAVGEQLQGGPGYSVSALVRELVESASVPFLLGQRYKASGLLKRADWESVWALQRREDAIDAALCVDAPGLSDTEQATRKQTAALRKRAELGDIPVPPKYASGDFKKAVWWALRGKLDVPKERWVLYPGVERNEDPSPVLAWAGWDHAQQAQALAAYYMEARQTWAFAPEKLRLLLAGLLELLPWLQQWHSAVDPAYGVSPAESIEALLDAECHELGLTRVDLETTRMSESAPAPRERKPRTAKKPKAAKGEEAPTI